MDAFVTRKRKAVAVEDSMALVEASNDDADNEPTEVKLAILSSLHPYFSQEALLDVLLAHHGSVEESSAALSAPSQGQSFPPPKKPVASSIGSQTSLRTFARALRNEASSPKKSKLLSRKGATLHLFDPADIAEHTPCSIIHNFLPSHMANDLLREMLEESKTFEKATFKLFDAVVSSPHTSSFYVDSYDEMQRQKFEYLYNGARLDDVRQITPQLNKVKPLVQEAVNLEVENRIKTRYPDGQKLRYQSPPPWIPNAAFANSYDGSRESVGWHTDQLTYLGPRAVIGSLSLGVAREFRVRRIGMLPQVDRYTTWVAECNNAVPKDNEHDTKPLDGNAEGQIAIHLPHNSLLVMHAEMQEEWKHSIAPAQAIDPHPIAGNRRINITYRDYKPYLHPTLTPKCKCGVPTVLRVVQKKKENWGRYFWMCHTGYVPHKEACSFFQWAEFDDDGRPIWEAIEPPPSTTKIT